ncbi:hypothetical protein EV426DRAFT_580689 [Tirmania nivea]|nr:hypothetical protein EV426DRAFT_580689 [Tirmania nivea]
MNSQKTCCPWCYRIYTSSGAYTNHILKYHPEYAHWLESRSLSLSPERSEAMEGSKGSCKREGEGGQQGNRPGWSEGGSKSGGIPTGPVGKKGSGKRTIPAGPAGTGSGMRVPGDPRVAGVVYGEKLPGGRDPNAKRLKLVGDSRKRMPEVWVEVLDANRPPS